MSGLNLEVYCRILNCDERRLQVFIFHHSIRIANQSCWQLSDFMPWGPPPLTNSWIIIVGYFYLPLRTTTT